ncbi:MAG: hypothetical protein AB7N24_19830 [Dehalococcoidia bacterium]
MLQSLGLKLDRVVEGWEIHTAGERGIIFPTFHAAVEAVAELSGAAPDRVMVQRDGSVIVDRPDPGSEPDEISA